MRVGFAGTPEFAAVALRSILDAGFVVPLVLTQPDRPAGRGLKLQASAVKALALSHGLPVHQPRGLKLQGRWPEDARQAHDALDAAQLDVLVVAAYGLILPAWTLGLPRLGCLNIHASSLPRWRGAAPIHRAIEAGDARTGVTIMQMDEGLDTGPMLLHEGLCIESTDTTATLHDRVAALGGRLIVQVLRRMQEGGPGVLAPEPQPTEGVTYAAKIEKTEAPLDWQQPASVLERRIRAFDPFPGATMKVGTEVVKVWKAQVHLNREARSLPSTLDSVNPCDLPLAAVHPNADALSGEATVEPGTVTACNAASVWVQCGQGVLELIELQRPSARRQPAGLVASALALKVGDRLAGC